MDFVLMQLQLGNEYNARLKEMKGAETTGRAKIVQVKYQNLTQFRHLYPLELR